MKDDYSLTDALRASLKLPRRKAPMSTTEERCPGIRPEGAYDETDVVHCQCCSARSLVPSLRELVKEGRTRESDGRFSMQYRAGVGDFTTKLEALLPPVPTPVREEKP